MTLEITWIINYATLVEWNLMQDLFFKQRDDHTMVPTIVIEILKNGLMSEHTAYLEICLVCIGNITSDTNITPLIAKQLDLIHNLDQIN